LCPTINIELGEKNEGTMWAFSGHISDGELGIGWVSAPVRVRRERKLIRVSFFGALHIDYLTT
jgi:hypothetical protein